MPVKAYPAVGEKVGRWTILAVDSDYRQCRCDCGTESRILTQNLRSGLSKSCGCLKKEVLRSIHLTHGSSISRTYRIWRNMLNRCQNPNVPHYYRYGGRGIVVVERWLSFEQFKADMGECPPGHSIDRYPDKDGPYSPENTRWATPKQQGRNQRSNRVLTHDGRTQTLVEWAEEFGIASRTLWVRLHRGWTMEQALAKEKRHAS